MLGKGAKTNISYRNRKGLATLFALLLLVTTALGMMGNTANAQNVSRFALGHGRHNRAHRPPRTTLSHRQSISSPNCP